MTTLSKTTGHDPGGKVRLPLQRGVHGAAEFSPCGQYRYCLMRSWRGHDLNDAPPYALWIGMNPSTAEANIDDPTIRKEMRFTSNMGLSGYIKCNVMDYRATNPLVLKAVGVVPCSDENLGFIVRLAQRAQIIIAAWGVLGKPLRVYADAVADALCDKEIMCMGFTADGSPRHPLYLRNDATMRQWRSARFSQEAADEQTP